MQKKMGQGEESLCGIPLETHRHPACCLVSCLVSPVNVDSVNQVFISLALHCV